MTREQRSSALAFGTLLVAIATWKSGAVGVENNYLQRSAMRFWAWTHPAERQAVHDYLYSIVEYPAAENSRAIDWVRRSTSARSTILVYGFTPEIYVAAGRRPASRFVYDVPQRAAWSRDASRAALIADLARSRPEAILLESRDASLNVTGEVTDSYQDATHLFTELAALLNRDYETRGRIGRFHLYHRRDD
jgi:hypothetical protein